MARAQREMEGDANQRRKAAREARAEGKQPSEKRATLGASKQRKEAKSGDDHSKRIAQRVEGKHGEDTHGKPRPGKRHTDSTRVDS